MSERKRCKHGLFETCMMCYTPDGEFIGTEWVEPEPLYTIEQVIDKLHEEGFFITDKKGKNFCCPIVYDKDSVLDMLGILK